MYLHNLDKFVYMCSYKCVDNRFRNYYNKCQRMSSYMSLHTCLHSRSDNSLYSQMCTYQSSIHLCNLRVPFQLFSQIQDC